MGGRLAGGGALGGEGVGEGIPGVSDADAVVGELGVHFGNFEFWHVAGGALAGGYRAGGGGVDIRVVGGRVLGVSWNCGEGGCGGLSTADPFYCSSGRDDGGCGPGAVGVAAEAGGVVIRGDAVEGGVGVVAGLAGESGVAGSGGNGGGGGEPAAAAGEAVSGEADGLEADGAHEADVGGGGVARTAELDGVGRGEAAGVEDAEAFGGG